MGARRTAGVLLASAWKALDQVRTVMEQFAWSLDQVVKCTLFMADRAERLEMNQDYLEICPAKSPARSVLGARVDIECMAAVPQPGTS